MPVPQTPSLGVDPALEESLRRALEGIGNDNNSDNDTLPAYGDLFPSDPSLAQYTCRTPTTSTTTHTLCTARPLRRHHSYPSSIAAAKTGQQEKDDDPETLLATILQLNSPPHPSLTTNQRFHPTPSQQRLLNALHLQRRIAHFSRGRMEGQRAMESREMAANALGEEIVRVSRRGSASGRGGWGDRQRAGRVELLERARVEGVVEKLAKGRYRNQEWLSPAQKRHSDLADLHALYTRILTSTPPTSPSSPPKTKNAGTNITLQNQRYSPSQHMQKLLFFSSLGGRLDRLSRVPGQDAVPRKGLDL